MSTSIHNRNFVNYQKLGFGTIMATSMFVLKVDFVSEHRLQLLNCYKHACHYKAIIPLHILIKSTFLEDAPVV
jgi:hypothetical protein